MRRTLEEFPDLTPAETRLVALLRARDRRVCVISAGVPGADTADVRLRASLLRELAMGRVEGVPLPETELQVRGAWIFGDGPEGAETRGLDLEGCSLPGDLVLFRCHLPDLLLLRGAKVRSVFLNGSRLDRGLGADRLQAEGGVFLHRVQAKGEVRLPGARLGGDLSCVGARLNGAGGDALGADGLQAEGDVFLRDLVAQGAVRLPGARLGGDLDCEGAQFEGAGGAALSADGLQAYGDVFLHGVQAKGEVRLPGARLGGDLDCTGARLDGAGGNALIVQSARIAGTVFLRAGAEVRGPMNLTAAEIGVICDDPACWPGPGDLILDRCRYGAFVGAPVDAAARVRWLALQDPGRHGQEFWPQPHEECARVLREAGHGGAARAVLIEKERLGRAAKRARVARDLVQARAARAGAAMQSGYRPHTDRVIGHWLRLAGLTVWDGIVGTVIGYGRKPQNAFLWLVMVWALGAVVFGVAGGHGAIKPNDPKIQIDPVWKDCHADPGFPTQYACFMDRARVTGYPAFNALVYSADTLIPVIGFEMQAYWLPDDRTGRGAWARAYLWLHIMLGWGLTLLAVAGFSGLVKQDSK